MAEIIDIGISKIDDNGPSISISEVPSQPKSVNFGPGLDMLMNDKKKSTSGPSSDINIDDLNKLEADLNDLGDSSLKIPKNETSTFKLNIDTPNEKIHPNLIVLM